MIIFYASQMNFTKDKTYTWFVRYAFGILVLFSYQNWRFMPYKKEIKVQRKTLIPKIM